MVLTQQTKEPGALPQMPGLTQRPRPAAGKIVPQSVQASLS